MFPFHDVWIFAGHKEQTHTKTDQQRRRAHKASKQSESKSMNEQCAMCVCLRLRWVIVFFAVFLYVASMFICNVFTESDITVLGVCVCSISMSKNGQNSDKLDTCINVFVWICSVRLLFLICYGLVTAFFCCFSVAFCFCSLFGHLAVLLLLLANVDSFHSLKWLSI